jgi:hypothetical protein
VSQAARYNRKQTGPKRHNDKQRNIVKLGLFVCHKKRGGTEVAITSQDESIMPRLSGYRTAGGGENLARAVRPAYETTGRGGAGRTQASDT